MQSSIDARLDVVEGDPVPQRSNRFTNLRSILELINAEDKFIYVRDALKSLIKMDLDKLIVAVSKASESEKLSYNFRFWISWLPLKRK